MITFNFTINKTKTIRITIPSLLEKFNYYSEPTKDLHKFDEATVTFINQDSSLEIEKDIINEIVTVFHGSLKKLIANGLPIPAHIAPGSLGISLNNMLHGIEEIDLSSFWLWSSENKIATLMYSADNKIYLEIVPLYPWNFIDPEDSNLYIPFDDFMKNYKCYAFEALSNQTAIEWYDQCERILELIAKDN